MAERRLSNWLDSFVDYILPRVESKESFIIYTGLFTLAAALRRRVKVPKDYLGGWECPPHLYVMFVGPPGAPRKTTSMSFAIDILEELDQLVKGPTIATQASMLDRLVKSEDASIYITSEEFGDLIMKSKIEMFEFLTSMFDGKRHLEATTISRGAEFVERPCINLLAATTPKWISANMPETVIGGGFASRVIFVFEETTRIREIYYKNKIDMTKMAELKKDLVADLKHISMNLEGDFAIDDEAYAFMDKYYKTVLVPQAAKAPDKMKGYYERKPAHIHKIAMLVKIARSDELVIGLKDFEKAIEILEISEKNLARVFSGIGKNEYVFDMQSIYQFILENGKVKKSTLLETFSAVATPSMLEELIVGLVQMDKIKSQFDNNETWFIVK